MPIQLRMQQRYLSSESKITKDKWISNNSTELIVARKLISIGSKDDEERRKFKCKPIKYLCNDCERFWAIKSREIKMTEKVNNSRQLLRLIEETGSKTLAICKNMPGRDGTIIYPYFKI